MAHPRDTDKSGRKGKPKNFRLHQDFADSFANWCHQHGHTESLVFQVAFLQFASMPPARRREAIDRFRDWEASGFDVNWLEGMENK